MLNFSTGKSLPNENALEWANLKCRWASYFGAWPQWMDAVNYPTQGDIDRSNRQFNLKLDSGHFERTLQRAKENAGRHDKAREEEKEAAEANRWYDEANS